MCCTLREGVADLCDSGVQRRSRIPDHRDAGPVRNLLGGRTSPARLLLKSTNQYALTGVEVLLADNRLLLERRFRYA
jgi:hypothetical protein